MKDLSKRSFLSKKESYQEKLLSIFLKKIYLKFIKGESIEELFNLYMQCINWQGREVSLKPTIESISDNYHEHLKRAGLSLKEHNFLPNVNQKDRVSAKREFGDITTYLDNVRSAYNVGNILRTAEAFRLGPIVFSKNSPKNFSAKVLKTAMGTANIVPCYYDKSLKDLPRPWIAIETAHSAVDVSEFVFPIKCTIILGNEEYGVSQEILDQVDAIAVISMFGIKNSINIASAFAIVANQLSRL